MDSAVWGMQAVVERRRQEREADAAAHRRTRDAVHSHDTSERRSRPSRWHRRFDPAPAVAAAAAPEPAGNDLELTGVGAPR